MAQLESQAFLKKQKEAYLQHSKVVNKVQGVLTHQYQLQSHKSIPKKHRPKSPTVVDTFHQTKHAEKFREMYSKLYRESLQEAITQNTITLELEKARCHEILQHTEKVLCSSPDAASQLKKIYTAFLKEIKVSSHTPCPELKKKLEEASTSKPEEKSVKSKQKMKQPSKRKTSNATPPLKKQPRIDHFFREKPSNNSKSSIGIHNLSSRTFTPKELQLLQKGLSFTPSPVIPSSQMCKYYLDKYDQFCKSLRLMSRKQNTHTAISHLHVSKSSEHPSNMYRRIKFLPNPVYESSVTKYSGIPDLEDYIFHTKEMLDKELPRICTQSQTNLSPQQQRAIQKLQRARHSITIKPADKNLGIVILDTDDYLTQCCHILSDENSYRVAERYPHNEIRERIINTLISFRRTIHNINGKLYNLFQTSVDNAHSTLKLYGLPKIHKDYDEIPPLRPIVAQSGSMLNATAKFIDHVLQPLAQSYEDYIQNSTSLIVRLETLEIPENAILVTVDVESLYPSIPQTECLDIIYTQMIEKRHLVLTNPNFIIRLLHICVNHNYFEFAGLVFQQTHGTAMGAAFSPTIANIFLSVIIKRFLESQLHQPLLLVRYVDDIFIIWPNETTLNQFTSALNSYHPNLKYTHTYSYSSVNFLDLTIYKGPDHHRNHKLDIKTYQKPQNLYQYLDFSSAHPKSVFKSLVLGECIRFARTNTRHETFMATTRIFQKRLQERRYPKKFIGKILSRVKFSNRQKYLTKSTYKNNRNRYAYLYLNAIFRRGSID